MKKEVIGVRFKKVGRIYYFDPKGMKINQGEHVIVETVRGVEFGLCEISNRVREIDPKFGELKPVFRIADKKDIKQNEVNKCDQVKAFDTCKKKIAEHKLVMELIDCEYTFDRSKIIFYFTADGRIDFRDLVKGLASIFRTRIELRQIGVRDEAKLLNGIGVCGRTLCCATFLGDFNPVSIKMAKDQSLSLNTSKISGACGRLMCCLKYEQETYEEINKKLPKPGDIISTPDGKGEVLSVYTLREQIKAVITKKEKNTEVKEVMEYSVDDIKVIKRKHKKKQDDEAESSDEELKELLD
ncbi:MAG: stage 0 sporulation family protein [Lachnospirales bacterium]